MPTETQKWPTETQKWIAYLDAAYKTFRASAFDPETLNDIIKEQIDKAQRRGVIDTKLAVALAKHYKLV